MKHDTIALVGLSGSGKSTIGPLLAARLGWHFVDLDQVIAQRVGSDLATFFATAGEEAFRGEEAAALADALRRPRVVIATGGGIVERAENRERLAAQAWTVWLHAPLTTLLERLAETNDRPLLRDAPAERLAAMLARRAPLYGALADWIVTTTAHTPAEIAEQIARAHQRLAAPPSTATLGVSTPGGSYAIHAGAGLLERLPAYLAELGLRGRVWLVSDTVVLPLHGTRVLDGLRQAGCEAAAYAIPAGEQHKTLATVQQVYDWLLDNGVERGDLLLALGGGVVGDLAGFVAATVLRGIALVHLPTTVLAMVDSAIGGKTGVDHAAGKNLIGAFHQPRLVLADTTTLTTLPPAERAAGWAEAIKHGVIGDAELFDALRCQAAAALALREPETGHLIARAAAYKARVVSADEREQGQRITLNYGHTLGHAIEAESGYRLRHGEAVAIGMMAAGTIAVRLGLWSPHELEQQRQTLRAFGLPVRIPVGLDPERLLARAASDKKVRARRLRWVLPTRIGATTVRDDVPPELVLEVVRTLQHDADVT